jgi:hypothetical protein
MTNCPDLTEEIFISEFPEFENADNIELYINRAALYFENCTCFLENDKQYMVFLLTAHLLTAQKALNDGDAAGGIQTSASIDKISVGIAQPPFTDGFDYWLNQSKYGQQLLAIINAKMITPKFIGGSFQRIL